MTQRCPKCGKAASVSEYFCQGCGAPFFSDPAAVGSDGGAGMGAGRPTAPPPQGDLSQASHLDYGRRHDYLDPACAPDASPVRRGLGGKGSRDLVIACIVLALIAGLIAFFFFLFQSPGIVASPPPGYSRVPEEDWEELDIYSEDLEEGAVLDYVFTSDPGQPLGVIVIGHSLDPAAEGMPETGDVEEMQRYIDGLGEAAYDPGSTVNIFEMRIALEKTRPMRLGCGLVGMYVEDNPSGMGAMEILLVKRKGRMFVIAYLKAMGEEVPSQEMQHLIDDVTFN